MSGSMAKGRPIGLTKTIGCLDSGVVSSVAGQEWVQCHFVLLTLPEPATPLAASRISAARPVALAVQHAARRPSAPQPTDTSSANAALDNQHPCRRLRQQPYVVDQQLTGRLHAIEGVKIHQHGAN